LDLEQVIEATDWDAYREAIQSMVRAAIWRYRHSPRASKDRVYQVEVWTDIRARLSAVSFDTLHHAFQTMLGGKQPLSEEELETFVPTCTGVVYSTGIFLCNQYMMVGNDELLGLSGQDFLDDETSAAVCSRVDSVLADAVRELIDSGEFARLPHEPGVWFATYAVEGGESAPDYVLIDA